MTVLFFYDAIFQSICIDSSRFLSYFPITRVSHVSNENLDPAPMKTAKYKITLGPLLFFESQNVTHIILSFMDGSDASVISPATYKKKFAELN